MDVAIAYNRNMYTWVPLYLTNQCPVGVASIHLTTGSSVDGQGFDATILQLFCQLSNNELFVVPTQTCLYCDGQTHGFYYFLGDLQHLGNVLKHTSASTLARNLLHRASEVQVYHVGSGLLHNFGCLYHRFYVATIDLNANGTFRIADSQFLNGRLHIANQGLGTYELRIYHSCPEPLTKQSKTNIRHILHGCQEYWTFAELYISYLHFGWLFCITSRAFWTKALDSLNTEKYSLISQMSRAIRAFSCRRR